MPYVPVARGAGWMPYVTATGPMHDRALIAQIRLEGREVTFTPAGRTARPVWGIFHDNPEEDLVSNAFRDDGRGMNPGFSASKPMLGVRLADFDDGHPKAGDLVTFGDGQRWRIEDVQAEADLELGYADLILTRLGRDR